MRVIELVSADGCSRAAVSTFGARVLSWRCRGCERLFVPDSLARDERAAPHGGIPVLHPQFGHFGPGRKHGRVRDREWMLEAHDAHSASFRIRLTDEAAPDAWAHAVGLHVELSDDALVIDFSVSNIGRDATAFTCGLHTYLRVDDIAKARLSGLEASGYLDALDALASKPAEGASLCSPENVDRVYTGAPMRLRLDDAVASLAIVQAGFGDTVVWNPGAELASTFSDLADDEWRRFLCVEAAQIQPPVMLASGASWRASQRLQVLDD